MKNLLLLLFILAFQFLQAQQTRKDLDLILSVYEKSVVPYLDEKIRSEYPSFTEAEFKQVAIARRVSIDLDIEDINRETKAKFKENTADLRTIQEFIETKYRLSLGILPKEFYKKVSIELDKL
jgi:hypothetical protein